MENKPNTVYHRGAIDGLYMGIYLTVMFVMEMIGMRSAMAAMLALVMLIGIPVLAYRLIKKGYVENIANRQFSAMWMHGIMMFLCGSLIVGMVSYIYFRLINPTFIADMVHTASEMYMSLGSEEADNIGKTLQRMIDKHLLPTPIALSFSMMWLGSFLGAMLSLILSLIIKISNPKQNL